MKVKSISFTVYSLTCTSMVLAAPDAPRKLKASDITSDSVTLSWKAPKTNGAAPVAAYVIEAKKADGSFEKIAQVDKDSTSFIATGLSAETEYTFAIKAISASDEASEAVELEKAVSTKAKVESKAGKLLDAMAADQAVDTLLI